MLQTVSPVKPSENLEVGQVNNRHYTSKLYMLPYLVEYALHLKVVDHTSLILRLS